MVVIAGVVVLVAAMAVWLILGYGGVTRYSYHSLVGYQITNQTYLRYLALIPNPCHANSIHDMMYDRMRMQSHSRLYFPLAYYNSSLLLIFDF